MKDSHCVEPVNVDVVTKLKLRIRKALRESGGMDYRALYRKVSGHRYKREFAHAIKELKAEGRIEDLLPNV